MRNNETGEFELVVGNRQLLSGFFIVVLLFAVAFAMGYVVGQNAPHSTKLANETAPAVTPAPVADGSRPAPAAPATPPSSASETAAAPPQETAAAPSAAATDSSASAPPAQDAAGPAESASAAPPALATGTYWQVVAVQQHEAEIMAAGLREKGLPVVLTPGTKGLTRVLVGPYNNKGALGRAKTELENVGLHPILFK